MRYTEIDPALFIGNRFNLLKKLPENSLAILCANSLHSHNADAESFFKQNSDFFYFTGVEEPDAVLIIYKSDNLDAGNVELFKNQPSLAEIRWHGEGISFEKTKKLSGISNIYNIKELDSRLHKYAVKADMIYLNSNEHLRSISETDNYEKKFLAKCKAKYPLHTYRRLNPLIRDLRMVKSDIEIALIQKACSITENAIMNAFNYIKDGVYEYEIEAELTGSIIKQQSYRFAYSPIIASGKNSCVLHYNNNENRCFDGDLLLLDVGSEYANYASDITRVVPVSGKFTPEQKKIYQAVDSALQQIVKIFIVGKRLQDLQIESMNILKDSLFSLDIIKNNRDQHYADYIWHSIFHQLGLDTHDNTAEIVTLQKNIVIAIEPAIYISEKNIGIRLENTYVVKDNGLENLCCNLPIAADHIEALINK